MSGGKERRLVELIKGLSVNPIFEMEIVLTRKIIHYKEIFLTNIRIHYVIRKEGFKKDPMIFYKFYKIAINFKPDIIHVWGNVVAIYAIPTKILLNIPMINSQIADAPSKVSNSILGHKLSFPFSDRIIANSNAGLKAYDAPIDKSSIIYNGFDFDRISNLENKIVVRNKFNILTRYVVGMVATFSDMKDYGTYIKAANIILSKRKDVTFLCIGDGEDLEYRRMVSSQNKDNILFLGEQSHIENIMNICDIGVLATYTEGISNALLEFSALGKPVITTFGGGNIELVKQAVTGYLINQKSPDELAEKIELLLNNKESRMSLGSGGRKKVKNEFSMERMITDFIFAYKELIGLKNSGKDFHG